MSPRKKSSSELTKDRIIQTARTQFIKKDFSLVSMREIAKELGCTHGALYYYFKNKAELFNAIVEEDFSTLNQVLEHTLQEEGDDTERLHNILLRFIEFGLNHQSQFEMMFTIRNSVSDTQSEAAALASYQNFAQAVGTLSPRGVKVNEIWSAFLSLQGFVSYYSGFTANFKEAEEAAKVHAKFILKALQCRES
ncbi:TetR/AcrR family transcriptional regulator [Jeotgalibacillus sp. ET6]|uniref:TetR/AcrR family transcriptional regulator n=1 Tax=Jeotgalibacillus sp. ET6 TaxID=3037260 RepID=UPI00241863CA|nr:TetR/AcrR family transcriptional regulator [Jeotgalibacillus sp. ET6]MDG5472013.1 TetR/AcrR family transcriptional regulator [Jeotgalibacillus sp. ET6]